jgi:hypothetical protein
MKRRFLILSALTLMLLGTLFVGKPAEARRCGYENCVALYNACEASCNGVRGCIKTCQRDFNECVCANCNFQCGPLP